MYVNMTDKFMSGWGLAHNGNSYYCIQCDTYEQAHAVMKAAEERSEMKRIAISDLPRRSSGSHTSVKLLHECSGFWRYLPDDVIKELEAIRARSNALNKHLEAMEIKQ